MKKKIITSLFIIFLCFTFSKLDAATITWLGGNAAWDDASQWDTGTVPSSGDDVIIPSGYVKIYNGDSEYATSIEVNLNSRLYIYNGGSLEISGAVDNDGLHNMGRVYVYGELAINNITQTSSFNSAKAIMNERYVFTYSSSQINIKYVDDVAIENAAANSYFRVRGALWIYSVSSTAIFNQDRFFNYGDITIEDSGLSSGFLIANTDDFRNLASGEINLDSDIYGGISNGTSSASFRNYGAIDIDKTSIGLNNHGNVTTYDGSEINFTNNNTSGIWNRAGATITNNGGLAANNSACGIYNYGNLINNNSFTVIYANTNGSIRNFLGGVIKNYDYIYCLGSGYRDINNDGSIFNYNGGHIAINQILQMSSTGSFANYGFFITYGSNVHSISGSFGNKGVIDDDYGHLLSQISNDRVVVAPVSGPMQVGVPYPNVLDVASLNDVDIQNWKISQNGASAGTYNEATNEFTPNASAVGITTIYVSIYDLVTGVGRNFTLEIGSPILPLTQYTKSSSTREDLTSINDIEISMFPNPTTGSIQLMSEVFDNNQAQIQVFNSMGQLVQQSKLNIGDTNQAFDFSSDLTNGLYIVKVLSDDKELVVKRIQLQR